MNRRERHIIQWVGLCYLLLVIQRIDFAPDFRSTRFSSSCCLQLLDIQGINFTPVLRSTSISLLALLLGLAPAPGQLQDVYGNSHDAAR